VFIAERTIANLLRQDEQKIKESLQRISSFGLIQYTPQNDEPQIFFRKNRVATRDLQIDLKLYQQRKESFMQRVKTMVAYLKSNACRSAFIGSYFGDEAAKECGICDTCLSRKQRDFTAEEFASIASAIRLQLDQQPITTEQLLTALSSIKREKTWQVLQFLQSEKKIAVSSEGFLQNK
jgi:ATP-dependent DNA helicase RecQ